MKTIGFLNLLVGIFWMMGLDAVATSKIAWKNWAESVEEAKQYHKIILVHFMPHAALYRHRMDRQIDPKIFEHEEVAERINANYVPVQIHMNNTRESYLYKGQKLTAVELEIELADQMAKQEPVIMFYDPRMDVMLDMVTHTDSAEGFLKTLGAVEEKFLDMRLARLVTTNEPYKMEGHWKCNEGGKYYLWYEFGNVVSWYAEVPLTGQQTWTSRGQGVIDGDKLTINWIDTRGSRYGKGMLVFKIKNPQELTMTDQNGEVYVGDTLNRVQNKP